MMEDNAKLHQELIDIFNNRSNALRERVRIALSFDLHEMKWGVPCGPTVLMTMGERHIPTLQELFKDDKMTDFRGWRPQRVWIDEVTDG